MRKPLPQPVFVLLGVAAVGGLWLLFVPWDLSEVTSDDVLRADGLQNTWPRLFVIGGVVAALGCAITSRSEKAGDALLWGAGCAFLVLFAWRTSVATTRGANFWLVGLIFYALPSIAGSFTLAFWLGRMLSKRPPYDIDAVNDDYSEA